MTIAADALSQLGKAHVGAPPRGHFYAPVLMPAAGSGPPLAVMPRPADLTPADTSSTVAPGLARALRRYYPNVDEIVVEHLPDRDSIAAARDQAAQARAVVVGTIDGHRQPAQIDLVEALAATGTPVIAVAMRGLWDVAACPPLVTALATYSILPVSLDALAAVLIGEAEAPGRLPVALRAASTVIGARA